MYNIIRKREEPSEERKACKMSIVKFGRQWVIKTAEDYEKALQILEGNDFIAEMGEGLDQWRREKAEIARQRADVTRQAEALGII